MASGIDVSRMVRIGTVMTVDNEKHRVRVIYQDKSEQSGWLRVIDNRPFIPSYDVPQRTDYETEEDSPPSHRHDLSINQWMPHINNTVLVLSLPFDDTDGFVLGGTDT